MGRATHKSKTIFSLATHEDKATSRWPMAKPKLFSIGPWLFYDHESPLAGGSGGALAPLGRPLLLTIN